MGRSRSIVQIPDPGILYPDAALDRIDRCPSRVGRLDPALTVDSCESLRVGRLLLAKIRDPLFVSRPPGYGRRAGCLENFSAATRTGSAISTLGAILTMQR